MGDRTALTRRTVLAGSAALGAGLPLAPTAGAGLLEPAPDGYSDGRLRGSFSLRPGLIHLNAANLAPTWSAAVERMQAVANSIVADPSFENRLAVEPGVESARKIVAQMLGVSEDELALVRNASEANCTVINGLDLGPGDEVVIWDQNHESNALAWSVAARRRGFKVVPVATPASPQDPAELLAPFVEAFNQRTRVVAFSHIANGSGVSLPAGELCRAARGRGIVSLVDGAQSFGALALNLYDLGCDLFTASAHKWLCGPHETGILFVCTAMQERIWPSIVTHGWSDSKKAGARKFDCLGQRHDGRIEALGVASAQYAQLGPVRVEWLLRSLAGDLRARLADSGKVVSFATPSPTAMNAGILAFAIRQRNPLGVMRYLYGKHRISARVIPEGDLCSVRLCPHIYISRAEIGAVAKAFAEMPPNLG